MTISIFTHDHLISVRAENESGIYNASTAYSRWRYSEPAEVTGNVEKLISLDELVKVFHPQFGNIESGIIPPGLLYVTKNFLVFEKPPTYKHVSLIPKAVDNIEYDSDEPSIFVIPVPWQLYFVEYDSNYYTSRVRMHFMKDSLRESSQQMYMAPIPNLYSDGDLCRPFFSEMDDIERYSKDVAGVMASAYDWVWGSGTNLDLTETVAKYYTTFQDNRENTILDKLDESNKKIYFNPVHRDAFYCSDYHVLSLFSAWEKIDLYEISNLEWPKNSKKHRFSEDFYDARSRISEYLESIEQSDDSEDSSEYDYSHCESCELEDDYDDECSCECHEEQPRYRIEDVYAYFKVWPAEGVTYEQSFKSFMDSSNVMGSHIINGDTYGGRTRAISNIEDTLILS